MKFVRIAGFVTLAFGLSAGVAHADDADFLSGSTDALVLGPTGDFTAYPGYVESVDKLYLDPAGFGGTGTAYTIPDTFDFGPSVTEGETQLLTTVEADYSAGDFSASDPLTLFGYSQSASVISGDEQALADYGIPEDALKIMLVGDTSNPITGFIANWADVPANAQFLDEIGWGNLVGLITPDNLYPTEVYTISGDYYGDYTNAASDGTDIHLAYMGESATAIANATEMTEGLTNYFTIADPPLCQPGLRQPPPDN